MKAALIALPEFPDRIAGQVNESPIEQLLGAVDNLDADAAVALAAPGVRFLTVDGRRAEGIDAFHQLVADFLSMVRSTTHVITAQWHQGSVWIAEVEATYELKDRLKLSALPRALVLRDGPDGFVDLRVYGAHERKLTDRPAGEEGILVGERWMPPL